MIVIFFNIFGGLALFLYGLFILSEGLKQVFYKELKEILQKTTSNTIKAVGLGTLVTVIIQSSSVTVYSYWSSKFQYDKSNPSFRCNAWSKNRYNSHRTDSGF